MLPRSSGGQTGARPCGTGPRGTTRPAGGWSSACGAGNRLQGRLVIARMALHARRQVAAMAVLPEPATEIAHGPRAGVKLGRAVVHKAGEPAVLAVAGLVALLRHGLIGRDPAVGAAAHVQRDAGAVRLGGLARAALARCQLACEEAAHQIDEAACVGIVADGRAQRGAIGILHRAAGHLHGLLGLLRIVEVDGRIGQQQRRQRRHALAQVAGVEQGQPARRMAQPRHDLGLAAHKAVLVGLPGAFLLVLENHHAQGHRGHSQQHEHAAQQDALAEGGQAQARHFQPGQLQFGVEQALHVRTAAPAWPTQRKPRMGTFSMPSKPGSTSRRASRMVLTCLRTLSRLRPLLTTSNSSS